MFIMRISFQGPFRDKEGKRIPKTSKKTKKTKINIKRTQILLRISVASVQSVFKTTNDHGYEGYDGCVIICAFRGFRVTLLFGN